MQTFARSGYVDEDELFDLVQHCLFGLPLRIGLRDALLKVGQRSP
jgi:hypothetical protein